MKQQKVSVVIPAFNEEERLPKCIHCIRAAFDEYSNALSYEIVVCDNNSSDATAAIAASLGCKTIYEPENNVSKARNRGASTACGEWLLFIDADSWPSTELIGDVAKLINGNEYIGCGSTLRVVDGPKLFKYVLESKNWSMRVFQWSPGAFILCRKEAFVELGGFSEERYLMEDVDFSQRLRALGKARGQRFTMLHEHPINTSGRRGYSFGFWGWTKFALLLTFRLKKCVKDKRFADAWYKGER